MNACGCSQMVPKFSYQTLEFSCSQEGIYFQFLVAISEIYFHIFKFCAHVAISWFISFMHFLTYCNSSYSCWTTVFELL